MVCFSVVTTTKNYIVPEKAQKEGKNMAKNKIFAHNMNEETVKNMQKVLDYLFLEAFESDRLRTVYKDRKRELDNKNTMILSLVCTDKRYKALEEECAALKNECKMLENQNIALKNYVTGFLFDQKSGRGKDKKITEGFYTKLGINADFVEKYYSSKTGREKAIGNLVKGFGLNLSEKLVQTLCNSLGITLGYRATGTNDTLKGTFVKEQSLVACQKVFGRALVQFLADRCNSLNVHTIDEKVSIPEMVVCEYNEDGTKLLDYVIKDADGNDENGIDANHHEKECAPVPKDSEKITETLKDYEDKVKSVK